MIKRLTEFLLGLDPKAREEEVKKLKLNPIEVKQLNKYLIAHE